MTAPPFERTVCACRRCVQCCDRPGQLMAGDLERIAEHLGQPVEAVRERFTEGRGAVVLDPLGGVRRVPSIIPKVVLGRCTFLDRATQRCGGFIQEPWVENVVGAAEVAFLEAVE